MREFFGTDGIRGIANKHPMTAEFAVKVGKAVACLLKEETRAGIIVGKDTRVSGDMLTSALVSGICSMGVDAHLADIIPTPGVAFMTSHLNASAGIVISASHNPYYDNGIKIFNSSGFKLSEKDEATIEKIIADDNLSATGQAVSDTGRVHCIDDALRIYKAFLLSRMPHNFSLNQYKIAIDCSHGATYQIAPELFSDLGAEVVALFVSPDGKNINDGCGSENPEHLIKKVIEIGADIGLAFDGDGDRLIAVDEMGNILTGDRILAVLARDMTQKKTLTNNTVVTTIMSNAGFGSAMKEMGIKHVAAAVGDRNVMEKMISGGASLGGEDSGHMLFLNDHTTGDGILSALRLLTVISENSQPLSQLAKVMRVFPQTLISVEVKHKPDIDSIEPIKEIIRTIEKKLGEEGRVLVRYSGTQPVCRVMVEGPTRKDTDDYSRQIADVVLKELG